MGKKVLHMVVVCLHLTCLFVVDYVCWLGVCDFLL